jgi:hypothetical protein
MYQAAGVRALWAVRLCQHVDFWMRLTLEGRDNERNRDAANPSHATC